MSFSSDETVIAVQSVLSATVSSKYNFHFLRLTDIENDITFDETVIAVQNVLSATISPKYNGHFLRLICLRFFLHFCAK